MSVQLEQLEHIGVAVPSLEEALKQLAFVGAGPVHIEEVPDQGVRVACIPLASGCRIELLESTREDSPVGKFIRKKGAGIHHLAFAVPDIDQALNSLSEAGVQLVDTVARRGAQERRIAFLHPKSTAGVLIELCEVPPQRCAP